MDSRFERVADGVYYSTESYLRIGEREIRFLEANVGATRSGRIRICAHRAPDDPLHEMLILIAADSYVRPHRHPAMSESHHVVRGSADVVFFDKVGNIVSVQRFGPPGSDLPFFYRISEPIFHTILVRSDAYITHETTNGPYSPENSQLAPWAPAEDDREAVAGYRKALEEAVARGRGPLGSS